jgi:putative flippase GtrA
MSSGAGMMRGEVERFVRFSIVGVSNTVLTLATFALLSAVGLGSGVASALAFGVGAANGYVLNRSWTFRSARGGPATIGRYVAVQALGALFSGVGVALASADLSLRRLVAECIVLPFVTLMTYSLSRRLVFGGSQPA